MSTSHTPGPWYWDSDPIQGDPLGRVRYRVVARGKTVTQCYYSSSDPQSEHDARLISAAPDLLEALETAITVIKVQRDIVERNNRDAAWNPLIDVMSAAISKAKGQA